MLDNLSGRLAASWIAVAHADEVGDEPTRVLVLGEPWVVVLLGGELRAFADRCPHRSAPLSAGRVVGATLQCGYHGWRFAPTGKAVAMPALGGNATLPPRACLTAAAAVTEHLGLIWLAIEPPLAPLPELVGWGADDFRVGVCDTVRTKVSAARLIDHFMDAAHGPFVHAARSGVTGAFDVADDEILRDEWLVRSTSTATDEHHDDPRVETGGRPPVHEHSVTKIGYAGANAALQQRFPMTGGVFGIAYACQPETATSTRVYKVIARNDVDAAGMERSVKHEDAILQEDLALLERFDQTGVDLDVDAEVHTKADRLSVAWRRMMAAMPER